MKRHIASAIVAFAFAWAASAAPDFGAFAHRAYIAFDGYEGESTLTNFPAIVRLADGVGGFSHADCALDGGRDVRFSLGDGLELPSEVVSWNEDGKSAFYVRVPELTAQTRIMVFWGSAAAPARDPREKVWDVSYTGVYGMEDEGRSILDKSWTGAHGAAVNASASAPAGAVGKARAFSNEDAVYGNETTCPVTGKAFTLECWFKISANPSGEVPMLFFNRPPTDPHYRSGIGLFLTSGGKLKGYAGHAATPGSQYEHEAAATAAKDEWHHALFTWSYDTSSTVASISFYQDGELQNANPNVTGFTWEENRRHLVWTGYSEYTHRVHFTGQLDEIRISSEVRSADYAAAVYKNVADFGSFATVTDASSVAYVEATPAARPRHTVTIAAGEGGTVSPSGAVEVEDGGTITVTATPASASYGFHSWSGDCPELERFSTNFTMTVRGDMSLSAVFGKAYYADPKATGAGDGSSAADAFTQIQTAVETINRDAANFPAVLFVAPGTYTNVNASYRHSNGTYWSENYAFYVTNALAIRATEPRKAVIDLRARDALCAYMDNRDAYMEGLVVSNFSRAQGYYEAAHLWAKRGHVSDCAFGWSVSGLHGNGKGASAVVLEDGWIKGSYFGKWTSNNQINKANNGGALYVSCGIVDSCLFKDNGNWRSVLHISGSATVRNCLFTGNSAVAEGGAALVQRGGTNRGVVNFENCTFVGNSAPTQGGAVYADSNGGCNLVNCAFLGNSTPLASNGPDFWNAGLAHSVSVYADGVDGNVIGSPSFKDSDDGECRPKGTSLTVDRAFPLPWALDASATDIYGNPRLHGDGLDIGAAEYVPSGDEELEVNVAGDVLAGVDALTVNFSALVSGAGSQGLSYAWNFGDGTTSAEAAPSHAYSQAGYYTVSLTVTDVATGKTVATTSANMIKVIPTIAYVRSPDDGEWTPVEPYATYETAAATLFDAFNVGSAKIECGPGTIAFGNDRILAMRAVEIYGQGRQATEVNCNGNYLHLEHPGAILRDLTLFNTYVYTQAYDYQGAVNIYGGATVSNCVVRNPKTDSYTRMVWIRGGGRLVDTEVINSSSLYGIMAIGAFVDGPATIDRCVFSNLTVKATANNVCAILVNGNYSPAPLIRNTLIADCRIQGSSNPQGSAIYASGKAIVDNCTIAENYAKATESGKAAYAVYAAGDGLAMTNTVVWGNVCTNSATGGAQTVRDVFVASGKAAVISHCDFAEAETIASASVAVDACFASDPLFRGPAAGDYSPASASPCRNTGVALPWMAGTVDLAGNPRVVGKPDLGCFELQGGAAFKLLLR